MRLQMNEVAAHRPLPAPVLHLLAPDPATVDRPKWLEAALGRASFFHDMPGVMWRTARDLLAKGRLDTPGDLRRPIETAYDVQEDDLPAALRSGHATSVGKAMPNQRRAGATPSHRRTARSNSRPRPRMKTSAPVWARSR